MARNESRWLFGGRSRSEIRSDSIQGVVPYSSKKNKTCRSDELELLDSYYESRQYIGKPEWKDSKCQDGSYRPIRERAPLVVFPFHRILCQRITSKLVGHSTFPVITVPQDPESEEFFNAVLKMSGLAHHLLEPTRRLMNNGSVLVRFYLVEGKVKIEHYLAKHCYPKFQGNGELESVTIKYVYTDKEDKNADGTYKKKWFRLDLGMATDTKYKPIEFKDEQDPEALEWEIEETAEHNLGFVQGEWFRTAEIKDSVDGVPITGDLASFVDELNYSLSQSATAVSYNQDPQLTLNKMDEDEIMGLVRSSQKAWNLGREGEAKFLESNLGGVERAMELRDKIRLNLQDISRIVMLDPEKMMAQAQSGRAMEVLHGPMVDLVHELRPQMEKGINSLVLKISLMILVLNSQGVDVPLVIPPGFSPSTLEITWVWPPVFPQTMMDLREKVQVATQAASGNLISRETMTRWLAADFNVKNVEEEIQRIAAQPVINPFGGF
jgi:hypothetical protein